MITRFATVRYRPDSLRDEHRIIGLVCWSRDGWADRLAPGLPLALAEYAGTTIAELHRRINHCLPEDRADAYTTRDMLERFDGPYAAVIFSSSGSSIETPDETLASVWRWLGEHDERHSFGRWVWNTEEG